jgi:succinate dehydrogenase/fumarate reductase flavoprotein subunit
VARLIVLSALERRESRGAHFRRDFAAPGRDALYFVRAERGSGGPRITREPVILSRARPVEGARTPEMVEIGD